MEPHLAAIPTIAPIDDFGYAEYTDLGGVRKRIAARLSEGWQRSSRILDIGAGTGQFAIVQAQLEPEAHVIGLEPVFAFAWHARRLAQRASVAGRCHFLVQKLGAYTDFSSSFDRISFFLSLCDLLRETTIDEILSQVRPLMGTGAILLICEELPERAQDAKAALGYELQAALGYRYLNSLQLSSALERAGFVIEEQREYKTGSPKLTPKAVRGYIDTECSYNRQDHTGSVDANVLWAAFRPRVEASQGLTLYGQIWAVVARY